MTALPISTSPLAHHSNRLLLIGFCLAFPFVFFPGALFDNPGFITATTTGTATERYLYLPKLVVLTIVGVLGFLQVRRSLGFTLFVGLLISHLVWTVLSTLNARDEITYNLLGPYLRLDGLIYQFALVGFALFAYSLIRSNPGIGTQVMCAVLASASLQTLLLLAQRLGFDPIGSLVQWSAYNSPNGTLGHPGMVAGFLLPAIVIGAWLFLHTANQTRFYLLMGTLLTTLGLAITSNRAALAGLLVSLIAMWLIRRRWDTLLLGLVLVGLMLSGKQMIPNPQGFNRGYVDTQSFQARLEIWPLALRVLDYIPFSPLLGGGSDSFKLAILRNMAPQDVLSVFQTELGWPPNTEVKSMKYKRDEDGAIRSTTIEIEFSRYGDLGAVTDSYPVLLDRAHNLWLDRLLAFGIFSVFTWIVLYGWPVIQSYRKRIVPNYGVALAVVGLLVYYMAWFAVSQVEPIHVLLLSLLWAGLEQPPVS